MPLEGKLSIDSRELSWTAVTTVVIPDNTQIENGGDFPDHIIQKELFGDLKIMHSAILHRKVILNKSNFKFKYLKFVEKHSLKILTFFTINVNGTYFSQY